MDLDYEPVENVVVSDIDSDSSSESVSTKVSTPAKSTKVAAKSVVPLAATSSKKAAPTSSKLAVKTQQKVLATKKRKTTKRYDAHSSGLSKFSDDRSEFMWNFVCKRKLLSERLIHVDDHVQARIYKLLEDRELLGTVAMAKYFNKEIVLEFYANLKS